MAKIQDYVNVQAELATASVTPQGFSAEAIVADDSTITVTDLYKRVTKQNWDSELETDSVFYNYAAVYFAQALSPQYLYCVRWSETGSPALAAYTQPDLTVANWIAFTSGRLTLTDGTSSQDISAVNFGTGPATAPQLDATITATLGDFIGTDNRLGLYVNGVFYETEQIDFDTTPPVDLAEVATALQTAIRAIGAETANITVTVANDLFTIVGNDTGLTQNFYIATGDDLTDGTDLGPIIKLDDANFPLYTQGSDSVTDVESMEDVAARIQAKINAHDRYQLGSLDGAQVTFVENSLLFTNGLTGSAFGPISVTAVTPVNPDDFSDLFGTVYASLNGDDVLSPQESLERLSEKDDGYYDISERGLPTGTELDDASAVTQMGLAKWVQTKEKQLNLLSSDRTNATAPGDTVTIGAMCKAQKLTRTLCILHAFPEQFPDAASTGRSLPELEGAANWAFQNLSSVIESGGSTNPLSKSERDYARENGFSTIDHVGSNIFLFDGITAGGEEKRIMRGRDWFVARLRERLFVDQLNSDLNAFDNETMTKLEGFIWEIANQAIDRRILLNTAERPFTVNIPDADDIPFDQRQTRKLELSDAFHGYINSAINEYEIFGTWSNE